MRGRRKRSVGGGDAVNLIHGRICEDSEREEALQGLEKAILCTLAKPLLDPLTVVNACDALSRSLGERHERLLSSFGIPAEKIRLYMHEAKQMLSKDYLLGKIRTELGKEYLGTRASVAKRYPLGVLFHIAAGNMDGLPFYTVIEGLLTGNINILKLPREEGGLSAMIFQELFMHAPELAEYVYVFDYSANDVRELEQLADLSDAIVVWGGDAAIMAARKMAKPNTRIIEWGHKLSFAYVTQAGMQAKEKLRSLAEHIVSTQQLLCSSCQGIFVDTDSTAELHAFCETFLDILHDVSIQHAHPLPIGTQAQLTLQLYNASLESLYNASRLFQADGCSIIAYEDKALVPSLMFRNCWVKRLPKKDILATLKPYKGYLQTVGLICANEEAESLSQIFFRAGAVRVTEPGAMSRMACGDAHDGEYPLERYTKVVSCTL